MRLRTIRRNLQRLPYQLALSLLTVGASLILGFLSFGGMYALLPVLPLAFAAFGLSVAYEGEIYLQNIKGALKKLFKQNYLQNLLAKEYLQEPDHFPDTNSEDCPQFFRDYELQLKLLETFGHKKLNAESKKRKKQVERTLRDMTRWFALQLFPDKNTPTEEASEYTTRLKLWLAQNHQQEWQERLAQRGTKFQIAKVFSIFSAVFMGLGSTYLIVEAFSAIPFFATIPFTLWPVFIVPMALVAGAAYGMLTFNSITDMINNNTLVTWYTKIRDDLSEGLSLRNVLLATTAVLLVGLAIALTVCTAGTWWTIATNARPLFGWMKRMPTFIMGVVNPIITGLSAIFFNLQNTAESLEMLDEETREERNVVQRIYDSIVEGYQHLRHTENWLQILNPFRIVLKITITPLRLIFFMGHLLSIAVTADRMPGVSQITAALIAIISEGFEDAHYFFDHDHGAHDHDEHDHHEHGDQEHHEPHPAPTKQLLKKYLNTAAGHNHDADIPTWILKKIASPIYALAALWDSSASTLNRTPVAGIEQPVQHPKKVLDFWAAWDKQQGIAEEQNVALPEHAEHPSHEWQKEHIISQIERYETNHLNSVWAGQELAAAKITELHTLKEEIRASQGEETLTEILRQAQERPAYNRHRMFTQDGEKTSTRIFLDELPQRVNAM